MKNIINALTETLIPMATEIDSENRYSSHDAESIRYMAEKKATDVIARCGKYGTVTEFVNVSYGTFGFSGYFKTEQGIVSVVTTNTNRGGCAFERTSCKLLKRIPKEVEKAFEEKAEAEKKTEAPKAPKAPKASKKSNGKASKELSFVEFKKVAMEYMTSKQDVRMLNSWTEIDWNRYWKGGRTEKEIRSYYEGTMEYKQTKAI